MTVSPPLALGEERQADDTEEDVQRNGDEPAAEAEGAADQQDAERLAGDRDGRAWDRDGQTRRQKDEQGAGDNQGDVPDSGVQALADADRDEKIGDREPVVLGRRAVEPGDGERHLDSGSGVTQAVTTAGV